MALSRAASEVAKRYFRLTIAAHIGSAIIAVASLFVPVSWSHVLAVCALVVEAVAWGLRYRAARKHSQAEEGRRAALLMWAFGSPNEPLQASDLRASFGAEVEKRAETLEDPNYYGSMLQAGQERFVEAFQESAFWSKHLYRLSAWTVLAVCLLTALLAVGAFVLLEPTAARGVLPVLAKLIVPIIGLFISIDLLGQGLGWLEAQQVADRTDRILSVKHTLAQDELMALFADYSVATAGSYPIPTFWYKREWARLEAEWKRRGREHGTT